MKIPKNYYHDKTVLALLGANAGLFVLNVSSVLINVDTGISPLSIVAYRSTRSIQVSGPTSDLYQFAIFALIITVISILLSVKLFNVRRHLAISILGLNVVSLLLGLVVFNALTRTL